MRSPLRINYAKLPAGVGLCLASREDNDIQVLSRVWCDLLLVRIPSLLLLPFRYCAQGNLYGE